MDVIAAMHRRYNIYDNNCQKMTIDLLNKICTVRTGRFAPSWDRDNPVYSVPAKRIEIKPVTVELIEAEMATNSTEF